MGQFGTYCGSVLVRYLSQVQYSQLGLVDDAAYNGFIQGTLVPQAEKFIDSYCNHSFGTPSFSTMTFDGNGKSVLFLPPKYSPMMGISNGSINSVAISPITNIKVHDQYLEYDGGNFATGKQNVVFYGSYGYAILPNDIEFVCGQLCANVILDMVRRRRAPDLFTSAMEGGGMGFQSLFAMPNVFQPGLKQMLDNYKLVWVDLG